MAEGFDLQDLSVLSCCSVCQSQLVGHHGDSPEQGDKTSPLQSHQLLSVATQAELNGWKIAETRQERWLQSVLNNIVYYLNEPPDYQQNESDYALPDPEDTVSGVSREI